MDLCDIHQVGPRTREQMADSRQFPHLARHGILLTGISEARSGFSFARAAPSMGQVLACLGGRGEVLLDERWTPCREGEAYLTPPGAPHAYRALPGPAWKVCWVMYDPQALQLRNGSHFAPAPAPKPLLVRSDPTLLHQAILGLLRETRSAGVPAALAAWADLVHLYAQRLLERRHEGRLWKLWEEAAADLARPWTLSALARAAHLSDEHLRRLSLRETGRTPMRQLTHLRMRQALILLRTPMKVAAVGEAVGYGDPFAFSTAFKRWNGRPPAACRAPH